MYIHEESHGTQGDQVLKTLGKDIWYLSSSGVRRNSEWGELPHGGVRGDVPPKKSNFFNFEGVKTPEKLLSKQ